MNIDARTSRLPHYESKGLFKIKQKCLTSGKLIAFEATSNLSFLEMTEGDWKANQVRGERREGGESKKEEITKMK